MLCNIRSRAIDFRGACMQLTVGTLDPPLNRITAIKYGFGKHAWNIFVILSSGFLPKLFSQLSATLISSWLLCRTFSKFCETHYLTSRCHPFTLHTKKPSLIPLICLQELFLPIAHLWGWARKPKNQTGCQRQHQLSPHLLQTSWIPPHSQT